jgi:two-component system sensor histidine kinase UhpB
MDSELERRVREQTREPEREALEELQLVTKNMPALVARCSRDLRYLWVSPSYAAWLGHAPEEVAGRPMLDVIGQEAYETILPHIVKVLSGEREEYEAQLNYIGVGLRWVHVVYVPTKGRDDTVDGWIAAVTDVTERHGAEERLRESEERFRAIFFQAAVGIAQTTTDRQWLLLNDRLCQILGYSREELRGKTFIDITHPDDRESSLAAQRKLLAGDGLSSMEKRYIRKDGSIVWARVFLSVVRGLHGEAQGFVAVVEDITERIQAHRALQQSRQELRALTGRLINAQEEERRRISRELHDDLGQKLALLAVDAGSLAVTLPPSMDAVKHQIRNVQARVVQLSADVRRISHRLHPSILEDLGLRAALSELCEEFSAREGIEVAFTQETVPEALPRDIAACLYRVAQEALHNIVKHAGASEVRLNVSGSREGIHFCIHDNGVGFNSEAALSRPGLGLISMKERTRLVSGEFSIDSRPEWGTDVRVFIPLAKETF